MKKRIIIFIIVIILILVLGIFFFQNRKVDKFRLESKYYGNNIFIEGNYKTINKLEDNKESYLLFTYLPYCSFEIPCDEIFKSFMDKYNISIYYVGFDEVKKSSLSKEVLYAPSVIIVNKGQVVASLSADKDSDLEKYQDADKFTEWVSEYIYLE